MQATYQRWLGVIKIKRNVKDGNVMDHIKFLVGADPECFIRKDGKFFSAHGLIKGDKKNPFPVNNGAVQVDGMALEFNINPASTEGEFLFNVSDVLNTLKLMVPEYEVVATPVADFDIDYIKQQPAEALELGCDPDYNAWTQKANEKPDGERPFRTASGHIHVGWTNDIDKNNPMHIAMAEEATRQLDFYLGLPSLHYDKDTRRREMYGKAGCYRPKPYGVEYRTLSNVWLTSEKLIKWVYNNTQKAMQELVNGNILAKKYGDIQELINDSDVERANAIIKAENITVPV